MITEKLAQSFLVIANAVLAHQFNEIVRRVPRQCRLNEMRIRGDEVFRTAMDVGKVAAPSAGDQYLFADAFSPLQNGHAPSATPCFHRAHQAGSAGAEN